MRGKEVEREANSRERESDISNMFERREKIELKNEEKNWHLDGTSDISEF